MKKLINNPDAVVAEMVEGLASTYPGLRRLPGHTVLVRSDAEEVRDRQVALISGGGSGHEPAHAGYVGPGMLSAAVAGEVFTAPTPDAVLAAIRAVAGPRGALLIVKNYTGDRLNFGLAAEMARAAGIPVRMTIVADDVALADSTEHAGRRGIAGTVLVHKVAGAVAAAGADLEEVAAESRGAAAAVRTMGVALSACTVPAVGRASFDLGESEVEIGLGIHGEPGVLRGPLPCADALANRLLGHILADGLDAIGDRVVLMVNNLGGSTTMELAIVARETVRLLEDVHGLTVERVYAGTFLSALEMAGVSLSVMAVDNVRLARLDAPTQAPAWPNAAARPRRRAAALASTDSLVSAPEPDIVRTPAGSHAESVIRAVAQAVRDAAPRLNELDREVGDGDLGVSLSRGAEAVLGALPRLPLVDPGATLTSLGLLLQKALGGTSGPLYGVFLLRAAARLNQGATQGPLAWADAFRAGTEAVADLGGARTGDRTMLDALVPASNAFGAALRTGGEMLSALTAAADGARTGAETTTTMLPRRGRSSYLGQRALGHPDPGATAVAVILEALRDALRA
jgi:dihydroxyacetone kinase